MVDTDNGTANRTTFGDGGYNIFMVQIPEASVCRAAGPLAEGLSPMQDGGRRAAEGGDEAIAMSWLYCRGVFPLGGAGSARPAA